MKKVCTKTARKANPNAVKLNAFKWMYRTVLHLLYDAALDWNYNTDYFGNEECVVERVGDCLEFTYPLNGKYEDKEHKFVVTQQFKLIEKVRQSNEYAWNKVIIPIDTIQQYIEYDYAGMADFNQVYSRFKYCATFGGEELLFDYLEWDDALFAHTVKSKFAYLTK